jgi:lipid II:glycine glycyltransferase (peptidoglycan interpeptide bridge formation enzyme)
MEVSEINNKETWEDFLSKCEERTFLQSWNWAKFQKMMGNKIWRLGIYEIPNLVASVLVIKIEAKRGTFLFVPHGPNIAKKCQMSNVKCQIFEILLEKLKEIGKKENCSFIRIAPILERNEENCKIFQKLGFREAPIHIHPELTWELDLTPSEDELLMKMRKTTRYLIRQAQKKYKIEIEQKNDLKGIEIFNQLYKNTASRHHFVPFSLEYLKNEFLAFTNDNQIAIFLGKYKEKIISGGIFVFWQNIAFYHHGASIPTKIPVSYLLLWKAILEAKKRKYKKFNFWGIAPLSSESGNSKFKIQNSKHPWYGLTLFKMGFGGYKKEYVKTQDFVISPT